MRIRLVENAASCVRTRTLRFPPKRATDTKVTRERSRHLRSTEAPPDVFTRPSVGSPRYLTRDPPLASAVNVPLALTVTSLLPLTSTSASTTENPASSTSLLPEASTVRSWPVPVSETSLLPETSIRTFPASISPRRELDPDSPTARSLAEPKPVMMTSLLPLSSKPVNSGIVISASKVASWML